MQHLMMRGSQQQLMRASTTTQTPVLLHHHSRLPALAAARRTASCCRRRRSAAPPPALPAGGVALPADNACRRRPRSAAPPAALPAGGVALPADDNTAAAAAAAAAARPVAELYAGQRAVVVGAGPAGAVAALELARAGFTVDVYERRPEPKRDPVEAERAYIIIVIPRGQAALAAAGVPLPDDQAYVTKGTVRHGKDGKVGVSRESGNVTFSRAGLAQYLIDQAVRLQGARITFHFGAALESLDLAARRATFATTTTSTEAAAAAEASTVVVEGWDLLVGADGAGSRVRAAMQAADAGMTVAVDDSGREYKTYVGARLPPGVDIEPPEFQTEPRGATLHLWVSGDPWTTVTAHSNPDGSYAGTLSLKNGGFDDLTSVGDYEALLGTKFSKDLPQEWIPLIARQAFANKPSPAGKRVRCSRLDAPLARALLLGDAAHAVTPVFGQGANSALESCKVLGDVLQEAKGDAAAVPALFSATRLPDMHALNELDAKAYSFFRRRSAFDPDFLSLLSHVLVGTVLSKLAPFLYGARGPLLLRLGAADVRYRDIVGAVRRDALGAALLFAALGLWLSFKVAAKLLARAAAA